MRPADPRWNKPNSLFRPRKQLPRLLERAASVSVCISGETVFDAKDPRYFTTDVLKMHLGLTLADDESAALDIARRRRI
jgi:hypothetical protein